MHHQNETKNCFAMIFIDILYSEYRSYKTVKYFTDSLFFPLIYSLNFWPALE